MKKLRDQEGYIPLNEHTDRQAWALGYLCESFYKAGNLFEQSEERDIEIKSKLSEQGYEAVSYTHLTLPTKDSV